MTVPIETPCGFSNLLQRERNVREETDGGAHLQRLQQGFRWRLAAEAPLSIRMSPLQSQAQGNQFFILLKLGLRFCCCFSYCNRFPFEKKSYFSFCDCVFRSGFWGYLWWRWSNCCVSSEILCVSYIRLKLQPWKP